MHGNGQPIELIAHTLSTWHATAGHSSHRCAFTFTATGETLTVDGMGGDGGNMLPHSLFGEHGHTYQVNESIPPRDWARICKYNTADCYEHEAPRIMGKTGAWGHRDGEGFCMEDAPAPQEPVAEGQDELPF